MLIYYFHRVSIASIFLNLWVGAVLATESVAELIVGVRCRRPPIASRARITSSSVTGTVTAMARSYVEESGSPAANHAT